MDRYWESNALGTAPALPSTPSVGYPTDGNLGTSTPPTNPGAWWFHMITEEIRAVIVAAGLTPNGPTVTQLLAALDARYASGGTAVHLADLTGSNQSLGGTGYQKLPGGLILQWGSAHVGDFSDGVNDPHSVTFPITFPTALAQVFTTMQDPAGGGSAAVAILVTAQSASGFTAGYSESSSSVEDMTIAWFALGY